MKDRFLWFCAGYATAILVSAVIVARDIERYMTGVVNDIESISSRNRPGDGDGVDG
jgi:predicted GNAT superfamily acetyltransferase